MALATIPTMRHLDMTVRLRHLASLGFSPSVIFDVGAAHGVWALEVHGLWPKARIVGFEPNASSSIHLDRLKANVRAFEYHRCFLGRQPGSVTYKDRGFTTSILDTSPGGVESTAPVAVMDDLVASGAAPAPDFIKLDVQGFELDVLEGARACVDRAQGILVEVNFFRFFEGCAEVGSVLEFMSRHGYAWYDTMGIIRRPLDDAVGQMDLMFLKADHPLRADQRWG